MSATTAATTEPAPGPSSETAAGAAPPPTTTSAPASLSGHIGHLDAHQTAQLAEFKSKLMAEGLYRASIPGTSVAASHDDGTLLRFLRARRFVLPDALEQFRDTEAWRAKNNMDLLYEKIDIQDYEETRRLYPQWTGRRDRRGIPVYVFKVASLDSKTMSAYTKSSQRTNISMSSTSSTLSTAPSTPTSSGFFGGGSSTEHHHKETPARMLRLFALYENLTRFVMPLCSIAPGRPNPETPITQSNNIVDISGVGLRQFWNLRSHMQDASTLATAHYPETLDRIFIIGAPSFFPTVWSWIKKWFDPITTSKIFILPSGKEEVFAGLSQFIDPENIPTQYGGTLPYTFGELPKLDAQLSSLVHWSDSPAAGKHADSGEGTLPIGPVLWERHEHKGQWEAIAVGSVEGTDRREVVARLDEGMRMFGEEGEVPEKEKA
ncbi:CRAL/TRIO domain-containing protein [Exidia glandulosa HHB12029]|uniref:CRAL/TRIO domain-containing protein n=1 Tax=Exidia glandulosa HHB12029 TaxID=1314781 RepID=A0A166AFJ7_EXIGL|nr:CRAL/TRIO domain-containing protein [Exidia glandulosa HHB12029]